MFRNQPLISLRRVVTAFIILTVGLFVWYVGTHGRLTSDYVSQGSPLSYTNLSSGLRTDVGLSSSRSTVLPSGTYSVSVSGNNGSRVVEIVTVPRFLFSVAINTRPVGRQVDTIARNSLTDIIQTEKGLSSFEGASFRPLNPSNITNENLEDFEDGNLPEFMESIQIDDRTIVGFTQSQGGVQPVRYDTVSRSVIYYPLINRANPTDVGLGRTGEEFWIFDKKTSELSTYSSSSNDATVISLKNTDKVATVDGRPLISISGNALAVLTGPDFVSSNDSDAELTDGEYSIHLLDVATKRIQRTIEFDDTPVVTVAISTDERWLAASTPSQVGVFDIRTGRLVFAIPHAMNEIRWIDDNRFIASTQQDGVLLADMRTKTSTSIVSYSDIRPTSISFIKDDVLYFTGYSSRIDNAEYPDAYVADLIHEESPSSLAGLEGFPHQDEAFYVDYLSGIATVRLVRYGSEADEKNRERAENYIRSKLPGIRDEKIRFVYIDFNF
jgi:hypothetical protein